MSESITEGMPQKKATPKGEESVKVVIRCRPMSDKEIKSNCEKVIKAHTEKGVVELIDSKNASRLKQFTFDTVYDESAKQIDLYDETFRPLVDSVLMGFNGTVFAYGQTGAGKTFTMEGDPSNAEMRGIMSHSFEHIFNHINRSENVEYLVTASYLEIYQEDIRDLLSEKASKICDLRQHPDSGVYVQDITVNECKCKEDLEDILETGKKIRSIGATNMNVRSSRSHAIYVLTIEHCELGSQNRIKTGKLNLVDLAGSERQSKTGVVGQRQKESIKINLSLSALGNVISALVDGNSSHIPYRDSKLTRLLQDSLGGNSKTIMVANIGPASSNYDETLTTLRFANRAKNIKNTPVVNEDPKDALLKKYKEEIECLKEQLYAKEKRKKKRKDDGKKKKEFIDDDINDDDTETVDEEEERLRQREESLKEEKARIVNDQNMLSEEKEKLLGEIKIHEEQLIKENEEKDALSEKIKAIESRLLCGDGRNIVDHTNEQQKQLEERRKELAEQKVREREILRKLEEEEETTLEIKETYTTLRQECDAKTKKLKKLFQKFQNLKHEIHEEQEINSRERQEKERVQDTLMKQLKYTHLVIENFIPPEDKEKLLDLVTLDEDENAWTLKSTDTSTLPLARPCISSCKNKRPVCEYSRKLWNHTSKPRYVNENIAVIDLDKTGSLVRDYTPPDVNPLYKSLMETLLQNEEELEIDAGQTQYIVRKKTAKRRARSTSYRKREDRDEQNYPMPRGLVPRN